MSISTEGFARVRIDKLLENAGWNLPMASASCSNKRCRMAQ